MHDKRVISKNTSQVLHLENLFVNLTISSVDSRPVKALFRLRKCAAWGH